MTEILTNWDGKHYEQHSKHQKEWGSALVRELKVSGFERILDLGCGNGVTTQQLAARVPDGEVVGIDNSPEMLAVAEQKQLPNMSLKLQDINDLSYGNEFDVVFSNAALHWVQDHTRLMTNIYRALKPGGFMRLQFAADGNCATLISVLRQVMGQEPYRQELKEFKWPWYLPTQGEYAEVMKHFLFKPCQIWVENADRFFASAEELVGWIDNPSLIPFMQVLPDRLQGPFRTAVIDAMLELTSREIGTYFETFRRINVYAVK